MMILKRVSLMVLVGIIIVSLIGCSEQVNNDNVSKYKIEKQENWTSINDEVFIYTRDYEKANLVLVKSGDEAALIDIGYDNTDVSTVKEYMEKNNLQLKYLIMTHMHSEQIKNFSAFNKMVKGGKTITPSKEKDNKIISLGDKTLKIVHTPGHSGDKHISVEINDEILVAGDIVTTDENTKTCITYDNFKYSIETLEKLKDKEYSLIIPGHGDIFEGSSLIGETLNTLKEQFSKNNVKKEEPYWTTIDDEIFVSTGSYQQVTLTLVTSGNEATVIDTGLDTREAKAVKKYIEDNNLILKNLILTHGHHDHKAQIDMFMSDSVNLYDYDNSKDGQVIEMGDKNLKIIFTPGHCSDRHMSVEINEKILVAGDVITSALNPVKVLEFGGNRETLINTLEGLKEKNYTIIVPGHGDTCIGDSVIDDHLQALKRK